MTQEIPSQPDVKSASSSTEQTEQTKKTEQISPEQIKGFLNKNPNWLYSQPELLSQLNLRAEVHGATSLLEHQAQVLRKGNEEFKSKLAELNANAQSNQTLIESLLNLCVQFLETQSMVDVYNVLQHSLPELYTVEFTQLIVYEQPVSGNFRLLANEDVDISSPGHHLLSVTAPHCAQISAQECLFLFGLNGGKVRSTAVIPLRADDKNYGVCCLGSEDPQRYHPDKDLAILDYISRLVTTTLERVTRN
ncbi:MAG: DUF484 family protein [Gammaproteobacteria bacterium]|nr:DUF484 family protein [Pseudomonadota bacterium]MCH9663035.1 DUF484 family protein [Gammaproteobacteria bacterium]